MLEQRCGRNCRTNAQTIVHLYTCLHMPTQSMYTQILFALEFVARIFNSCVRVYTCSSSSRATEQQTIHIGIHNTRISIWARWLAKNHQIKWVKMWFEKQHYCRLNKFFFVFFLACSLFFLNCHCLGAKNALNINKFTIRDIIPVRIKINVCQFRYTIHV